MIDTTGIIGVSGSGKRAENRTIRDTFPLERAGGSEYDEDVLFRSRCVSDGTARSRRSERESTHAPRDLSDEPKVELLGGIPFVISQNPPHILAVAKVFLALQAAAALPRWFVNRESHISLRGWLPIPDVLILRGPMAIYGKRLARARDVALLVEISDTTYAKDSGPKLRRYARFRIPVYWIVDLNRRMVEVRTRPFGKG